MRHLLVDLDRWQRDQEEIALATLVRVQGSAPRLPGARMGVTRSGQMSGSVSGGCVENDVVERALQVLDRRRPVVARYGISDQAAFEVGLSCGGTIDVLIEPFAADQAWEAVRQALVEARPAALCVALEPDGLRGRRLAVLGDGSSAGSVHEALDAAAVAAAGRFLAAGDTGIATLRGETGDEVALFVESFPAPARLFVVGATQIAVPLCRLAKPLGFRVTLIDPRGRFASPERFPEADEILGTWPDAALADAQLDASCFVVTLTHDAKLDLPALAAALRSPARYVGALGSRRTHAERREELRRQGFGEADLNRIRSPIGLDLGGRSPEEIALAIVAEMLAVRHVRRGGALSETGGTRDGDA